MYFEKHREASKSNFTGPSGAGASSNEENKQAAAASDYVVSSGALGEEDVGR